MRSSSHSKINRRDWVDETVVCHICLKSEVGTRSKSCQTKFALAPTKYSDTESLFPKGPYLPSPPAPKVLGRHTDPDIAKGTRAQMTIVRTLHAGIWIIPFGVWLNSSYGKPHNFSKYLTNLVFCEFVLASELQYPWERGWIGRIKVFVCNICIRQRISNLRQHMVKIHIYIYIPYRSRPGQHPAYWSDSATTNDPF